jgi:hypothetical protein
MSDKINKYKVVIVVEAESEEEALKEIGYRLDHFYWSPSRQQEYFESIEITKE